MLRAQAVAEYFLWLTRDQDEQISNLKLQKLLYYAQGYYLANSGSPLFDAPIHAWDHGPVVKDIYDQYKQYGRGGIPAPPYINERRFREAEKKIIQWVFVTFGKFSGTQLRNMTHNEPLWRNAKKNEVMQPVQLREYFLTRADVEPVIVFTQRKSWKEMTEELFVKHRNLWERLAQV
ncbi:MAG: hypothetical protein CSA11_07410 [Chloroflexi bacterium]|nr:MAG: hypothetical protein CSA11_07410 [Chloroflexota bacterium]